MEEWLQIDSRQRNRQTDRLKVTHGQSDIQMNRLVESQMASLIERNGHMEIQTEGVTEERISNNPLLNQDTVVVTLVTEDIKLGWR